MIAILALSVLALKAADPSQVFVVKGCVGGIAMLANAHAAPRRDHRSGRSLINCRITLVHVIYAIAQRPVQCLDRFDQANKAGID